MSETKPDRFLMWIALSTAAMAVLAALTTLYVGKYSSRTILMQGQETDQPVEGRGIVHAQEVHHVSSHIGIVQLEETGLGLFRAGTQPACRVAAGDGKFLGQADKPGSDERPAPMQLRQRRADQFRGSGIPAHHLAEGKGRKENFLLAADQVFPGLGADLERRRARHRQTHPRR